MDEVQGFLLVGKGHWPFTLKTSRFPAILFLGLSVLGRDRRAPFGDLIFIGRLFRFGLP